MKNSTLPTGVTESQVEAWKEKHGKVKQITCTRANGEKATFIIGQPTRDILDAWATYHNNDNNKKAREVLENSCILFGDKTLFEKDVNLQSTVDKKITEMLENYQAEEKEL